MMNRFIKAAKANQNLMFYILIVTTLLILILHFRLNDIFLKNLLISAALILYVVFYKLFYQTQE